MGDQRFVPDDLPDDYVKFKAKVLADLGTLFTRTSGGSSGGDPAWRAVDATGQPAFQNSWANYGGVFPPAGFRKLGSGLVVLEGLIHNGTLATGVFALPVGYRPTHRLVFLVASNTSGSVAVLGRVDVDTDGTVYAIYGDTFAITLNGVTFYAEQ